MLQIENLNLNMIKILTKDSMHQKYSQEYQE